MKATTELDATRRKVHARLFVLWLILIVISTIAALADCPFPGMLFLWGMCAGIMVAGLIQWRTSYRYEKKSS